MRARLSTRDGSAARNANFAVVASDRIAVRSERSAAGDTGGEPRGSAGMSKGGATWLGLTVCALLLSAAPSAHHSVPGQFDTSKPTTLTGTVSKVDWINPHVYVNLDVKTDAGTDTWRLGTAPPAMMRRAGLTREDIAGKPGEMLSIIIYPARDGTKHLGWITKITYADGHFFHLDAR
jgi:hypothetical protein